MLLPCVIQMIKECGFEFIQRIVLELKWRPEDEAESSEEEPKKKEEEKAPENKEEEKVPEDD